MLAHQQAALSNRTPRTIADLLVGTYSSTREAHHNQPVPAICSACRGDGEMPDRTPCPLCGGIGEKMNRAMMAHRMLSAPHGEYGCAGFTLPLVAERTTADPAWLANLIEHATDETGHALSCEQLLILFDYLCLWAENYEHRAPYWQLAGKRIMRLISMQLVAALPESEALA